jgi:hypothetical protein
MPNGMSGHDLIAAARATSPEWFKLLALAVCVAGWDVASLAAIVGIFTTAPAAARGPNVIVAEIGSLEQVAFSAHPRMFGNGKSCE